MYKYKTTSAEDYQKLSEAYIATFDAKHAKAMKRIEDSMAIYLKKQYGHFPAAGEIQWPVLKPNYRIIDAPLVPFNEAYSYKITNCIVHFFINDQLFMRVFRNPDNYIPFLKTCSAVIGPDMSQYCDMPAEMRYLHAYCNVSLSSMFQENDINLYPNITWSRTDSYSYSFPDQLAHSVIAINSNGVHKDRLALYRWRNGYKTALSKLSPTHIIRYGQKVDGELIQISSYNINERLKILENGSKRK